MKVVYAGVLAGPLSAVTVLILARVSIDLNIISFENTIAAWVLANLGVGFLLSSLYRFQSWSHVRRFGELAAVTVIPGMVLLYATLPSAGPGPHVYDPIDAILFILFGCILTGLPASVGAAVGRSVSVAVGKRDQPLHDETKIY